MRLNESVTISASPLQVWQAVADSTRYPEYIEGLTRWEPVGKVKQRVGDRFRMLLKLGSAEIGGLIEIVEWKEGRDLAWTSITGIDQRGRWRIRPVGDDKTKLEMRYAYGVAGGGIAGLISEMVAAPQMRRYQRQALREIKRRVEERVGAVEVA